MYRKNTYVNIKHGLLINENTSFINRQLYKTVAGKSVNNLFEEGKDIVARIFYLLDFLFDESEVSSSEYNTLFQEVLKMIKSIIPFKSNDLPSVIEVFSMVEANISNTKTKKDNQWLVTSSLEKIVEKIFTFINDSKFLGNLFIGQTFGENETFSFMTDEYYVKELLSTLYYLKLEINENFSFIESQLFYDNLICTKDIYSETISNMLNSKSDYKNAIKGDLVDIFRGKIKASVIPEAEKLFRILKELMVNKLNNRTKDEEFYKGCESALDEFEGYLKVNVAQFKEQVNALSNKITIKLIYFLKILNKIKRFKNLIEIKDSEEYVETKKIFDSITNKVSDSLFLIAKNNPLIGCQFFNSIAIELLLGDSVGNLEFYYKILKECLKANYKINTKCFVNYLYDKFNKYFLEPLSYPYEIVLLSSVYNLCLQISSDKSILEVNNIITTQIKVILNSADFLKAFTDFSTEEEKNLVKHVFNNIHLLKTEYFCLINKSINLKLLVSKLQDDHLSPTFRRIFTNIYTDIFSKNCFCVVDIHKFMESNNFNQNLLIENNLKDFNDDLEKENSDFFGIETTEEVKETILNVFLNNLKKYKYFHKEFESIFRQKLSFTIGFFKDVILFPSIYTIYRISYHETDYNSTLRYHLYTILLLFNECMSFFLTEVLPLFDLTLEKNKEIWDEFADTRDIANLSKIVGETLTQMRSGDLKVLQIEILQGPLFTESISHIKEVKENFFRKEEDDYKEGYGEEVAAEEEQGEEEALDVFGMIEKMKEKYDSLKEDFEKNIFNYIFQDEHLEDIQKEVALDLLYRLNYVKIKRAENKKVKVEIGKPVNYNTNTRHKRSSILEKPTVAEVNRRNAESGNLTPDDKSERYSKYYNPFISPYIEAKTEFIEIVDKLFKANPEHWQNIICNESAVTRDLICILITKQLPFLVQFLFIEFMKIDTKKSKYYDNFVNMLEFLRLLCEDHNLLFQSLLINYEKAIGKTRINGYERYLFIPFVTKIPVLILEHINYNLTKRPALQKIVTSSAKYFIPLCEKITDFLIEIIQGSYPENFYDITKGIDKKTQTGLDEYFKKHFQYVGYVTTEKAYEGVISLFFNFFNCFVEENANPLEVKAPIMIEARPQKLLNISIDLFKQLVKRYTGCDDLSQCEDMGQKLKDAYMEIYDVISNDNLFNISIGIFMILRRGNSYHDKLLGEKFKQIMETLKEVTEMDPPITDLNNYVKKEYFNFCNILVKAVEISYSENKFKDEKELFKYRDFFNSIYKNQVIDERNKSCKETAGVSRLVNVCFFVHPDSLYLSKDDFDEFLQRASYDNYNVKLNCILSYYPELNKIIGLKKTLKESGIGPFKYLCDINYKQLEIVNIIFAVITNICLAFQNGTNVYSYVLNPFALFHLICLIIVIITWYISEILKQSGDSEEEQLQIGENEEENEETSTWSDIKNSKVLSTVYTLVLAAGDPEILPFIWTALFGLFALLWQRFEFLFSLQLFPIFTIFETMWSVIDAVKVRYKQFISTAFLLVILILFYGALTFYFFRYDDSGEEYCSSYLECFLFLFNSGIRSGGIPFEVKISSQPGFWGEFIYSWIFYFIVILIILNIINGIIVDKFQDLREQNNLIYIEKTNVCFICSLHQSNFEIKGIDFVYHLQHEHCLENNFNYLCKITRTDEHDLNSIDFMIFNSVKENKTEFFPIKKAMSLQK